MYVVHITKYKKDHTLFFIDEKKPDDPIVQTLVISSIFPPPLSTIER